MEKYNSNTNKRPKLVNSAKVFVLLAVVITLLYFVYSQAKDSDKSKAINDDITALESINTKSASDDPEEKKRLPLSVKSIVSENDASSIIVSKKNNNPKEIIKAIITDNNRSNTLKELISYLKKYPTRVDLASYALETVVVKRKFDVAVDLLDRISYEETLYSELNSDLYSIVWKDVNEGKFIDSFSKLNKWQKIMISNPSEYYNLYSYCLSKIRTIDEATQSYEHLIKQDLSQISENTKVLFSYTCELAADLLFDSDKSKAIELYELGWLVNKSLQCHIKALSNYSEINNSSKVNFYIEEALKNKDVFEENILYWLELADIEKKYDSIKAAKFVDFSLENVQKDIAVASHIGWYLINNYPSYKNHLNEYLIKYSDYAYSTPKLHTVFTAGFIKVQDFESAMYWSDLSLQNNNSFENRYHNLTLHELANKTDNIENSQNKLANDVFKIDVLTNLEEKDKGMLAYLLLKQLTNMGPEAYNESVSNLKNSNPNLYRGLESKILFWKSNYYANTKDFKNLEKVHSNIYESSLVPPVWERVELAIYNKDRKSLKEIYKTEPLDRSLNIYLLNLLGRHKDAIEVAKTTVIKNDEEKSKKLKQWGEDLAAMTPTGTQTNVEYKKFIDLESYGFYQSYDKLMQFGSIGFSGSAFRLIGNESLKNVFKNEYEFRLNAKLQNNGKQTFIEAGFLQRQNGGNLALKLKQLLPINNKFSSLLTLWYNQRGLINGFTNSLTNNNAIKLSSVYSVNERIRFVLETSWNQYKSLWGRHLSNSITLQSQLSYSIIPRDPSLKVWTEVMWVDFNSIGTLGDSLDYYFNNISYNIKSIFPDIYSHIYFGMTYRNSYPGLLVHKVGTPHWIVKPFIGYNMYGETLDWGTTLGFGTSLFGSDELSLRGAYSSSPFIGFNRTELKLQYNLSF